MGGGDYGGMTLIHFRALLQWTEDRKQMGREGKHKGEKERGVGVRERERESVIITVSVSSSS